MHNHFHLISYVPSNQKHGISYVNQQMPQQDWINHQHFDNTQFGITVGRESAE